MFNQVVLIGRLVEDVNLRFVDKVDKNVANITLAVMRPFKSPITNQYETDFIEVTLWDPIAQPTKEYCHVGSVLAIKGRIQMNKFDVKGNGKPYDIPQIIAEKVIFLSPSQTKQMSIDGSEDFNFEE